MSQEALLENTGWEEEGPEDPNLGFESEPEETEKELLQADSMDEAREGGASHFLYTDTCIKQECNNAACSLQPLRGSGGSSGWAWPSKHGGL